MREIKKRKNDWQINREAIGADEEGTNRGGKGTVINEGDEKEGNNSLADVNANSEMKETNEEI